MSLVKCNSFVITRDHLDGHSSKKVAEYKKLGYTKHFKLYDDDGILYYEGYLHPENAEKHHEYDAEFAPLNWAMADSGCTEIKYRNKDTGKYETF